MKLPKISVIIPTYNAEPTLNDALNSVVSQTYNSIEILIVDGASTDKTLSIIERYREKYDFIKVISEQDEGIYDAMNKSIDNCTGQWLYFMGADDTLYNDHVIEDLHQSGAFNQDKVVYGNVKIIGDNPWAKDKTTYDGIFDLKKLLNKNICQQAIFYPKRIVKDNGYFNKKYLITADWDYNLRCFAKEEFIYVDLIIANFSSGGLSSRDDMTGISFREFAGNIFKYFNIDVEDPKFYDKESPFYKLISHYKYVLKTQLNPYKDQIEKGISLFTAVKNRKEIFEEALKTWVKHKEIDEIIIVDWSSDELLVPLINKYQNGKIFLAVVEDQPKWVLAPAFNHAARLTTRDKILKIDADIKLFPGFFNKHKLKQGIFFTGDWTKARNENETHLNGNLYLYRQDFFRVNGYNEYFKTYGWDDTDLFERLESAGLKRKCFDFDTLQHIEHEGRMIFQSPSKKLKNLTDKEWSRLNIFINRFVASKLDQWSPSHQFLDFDIKAKDKNIIVCKQSGEDENQIPARLIREAEVLAIKQRLVELGLEMPEKFIQNYDDQILVDYYNLYLDKKRGKSAYHLFDLLTSLKTSYLALSEQSKNDIKILKSELTEKDQSIKEKNKTIRENNSVIKESKQLIVTKNRLIEQRDKMLAEKDRLIEEKEKEIENNLQIIQEKNNEISLWKKELLSSKKEISKRDKKILAKEQLIYTKNQVIDHKDQVINNKELHIQSLMNQINHIYRSYSWRFGNFFFSFVHKVIRLF